MTTGKTQLELATHSMCVAVAGLELATHYTCVARMLLRSRFEEAS